MPRKQLVEADAKTFEWIKLDNNCDFYFGRDKNYLFINGYAIKNIDAKTFEPIGNCIFRDKDSAFFFDLKNKETAFNKSVIKGVNPNQIKLIKYPWAKAGNILINKSDTLNLEDIKDFTPHNNDWGETKKYIIYSDKIIYGADLKTFEILSMHAGRDKNYYYEFGFIAEDALVKKRYKDFDKNKLCLNEATEFTDLYENEQELEDSQTETSILVDYLKLNGFNLKSRRIKKWVSGPRVVSYYLNNQNCNCNVDKVYHYDNLKELKTGNTYKVTERKRCETI